MTAHAFASLVKWFPEHCDEAKIELMYRHWQLMLKWNARTNLTAIRKDSEALLKHYADSVVMVDILPGSGSVLDVGSGGGFPGIPLAIVRPDLTWRLLEPRQKRVSFLKATVARLGLKNVEVIAARSDETPTSTSDLAVTRATFSDVDGARTVLDWLSPGGALYALRSLDAEDWPNTETRMLDFGSETRRIDRLS